MTFENYEKFRRPFRSFTLKQTCQFETLFIELISYIMVRKKPENTDYGRPIVAESGLWPYVKNFGLPNGFITGLVLGQHSTEKDYVVHLARTPRPSPNKDVKIEKTLPKVLEETQEPHADGHFVVKRVRDIRESWVADHAKHVTRMLPGGIWVLGIFLVGSEDPFADNSDCMHLRSVLQHIKSTLNSNPNLQGNCPSSERIILYINPTTDSVKCRITDLEKGTVLLPATWTFEESPIRWQPIECYVQLDSTYPLPTGGRTLALKKQLEAIVNTESSKIKSALCKLGDELRNNDDTLESLEKKPKLKVGSKKTGKSKSTGEELKTIQASLYVPMVSQTETVTITDCSGVMNLSGVLASKVFLNPQSTIGVAAEAVKQDVVRSIASRLDMHWDSLIEEEHGSPEENVTLHEPPRRVLVPLPHSAVAFSDYLFPGEGPEEALVSSQELLDISVEESAIQKELELHGDPNVGWEAPMEVGQQEPATPENATSNKLLLMLGISLIVLLIAIVVKLRSSS